MKKKPATPSSDSDALIIDALARLAVRMSKLEIEAEQRALKDFITVTSRDGHYRESVPVERIVKILMEKAGGIVLVASKPSYLKMADYETPAAKKKRWFWQ